MNSKERAFLKKLANNENAILQIGKLSVTPEVVLSIDEALEKRELIKISILDNCMDDMKDISQKISERTHSEIVMVIGRKIVLYRESKNFKKIDLKKLKLI